VKNFQLCTGLLRRNDTLLLVRCRYEGEPNALWVLPGGRQNEGESIAQGVVREFREETGLRVIPESLAYASESIDLARRIHVVNCTFFVREDDPTVKPEPADPAVVEARFVSIADAPKLLAADVLRIPVAAALSGDPHPRYFAFKAEAVATPFFSSLPAHGRT
jgi:ADP-ribose pyrophosphatase YjhB (NUDIX family)